MMHMQAEHDKTLPTHVSRHQDAPNATANGIYQSSLLQAQEKRLPLESSSQLDLKYLGGDYIYRSC